MYNPGMKKIGLIGGMSWESTAEYYRIMNQEVKRRLGGSHSAEIIMYSVDFEPIHRLQFSGQWDKLAEMLSDIARKLEGAGADFIVIATNTMHKVAPQIEKSISIPLLHIADATAEKIKEKGLSRVGLLGTKFTMEMDFYRKRLLEKHGIEVIVPEKEERSYINDAIYNELVLGIIKEETRNNFKRIIKGLAEKGAQGIILGCTEIPLLIKQKDVELPIFDTTEIHAGKAVDLALTG